MKFVPAKPETVRGDPGGPPAWGIAVVVAVIVLVLLIFALTRLFGRGFVPYSDSDFFYVGLIALPFVTLIAVAVASKLVDFQRAQSWSQATGTIVRSEVEAKHHRFAGEPETVTNVPAVEYEFTAGGRSVRGSRIAIGEDTGGANLEATLARFPLGATVTVYYDPANPKHCVLDRGGVKGVSAGGCVGGLAMLAVCGAGLFWLIVYGPDVIAAHFPKANANLVVFTGCLGLVALLLAFAARRRAQQAASWPSVRGKVVRSEVEEFTELQDGHHVTSYRPAIEYSYPLHGRDYRGTQVKLGMTLSGKQAFAAKLAAKYPEGADVEVHYDPADPTSAALENPSSAPWLPLAVALAFFAVAVWQLGVF